MHGIFFFFGPRGALSKVTGGNVSHTSDPHLTFSSFEVRLHFVITYTNSISVITITIRTPTTSEQIMSIGQPTQMILTTDSRMFIPLALCCPWMIENRIQQTLQCNECIQNGKSIRKRSVRTHNNNGLCFTHTKKIQNTQEIKENAFYLDKTGQYVHIFDEVLFFKLRTT